MGENCLVSELMGEIFPCISAQTQLVKYAQIQDYMLSSVLNKALREPVAIPL